MKYERYALPSGPGKLKANLTRVLALDGSPERLAIAFAIGVFISFTPVFGFHTLMAIGTAAVLRMNAPAVVIGSWVNTPLTAPFAYSFCYFIGASILRSSVTVDSTIWTDLSWDQINNVIVQLTAGCSIIGFVASIIAYWLVFKGILLYRARRKVYEMSR